MPKHKFKSPHGAIKKRKSSQICNLNSHLSEAAEKHAEIFTSGEDITDSHVKVKNFPFPSCQLLEVVDNKFLPELQEELLQLELYEKDNDLYKFHQSEELNTIQSPQFPYLQEFRNFLVNKLRPVICKMTGIELDERLALFHARYQRGDYLLCHDDELEGRRIAFILYLVQGEWKEEDGGGLQLFTTAEGHPDKIVQTLLPKNNSLVFFEVSPVSFHQVGEVLSDKTRLSLGGWFHGKSLPRPEKMPMYQEVAKTSEDISEELFMSLINPMYFNIQMQSEIQAKFEETSELNLPGFLLQDKYDAICDKLKSTGDWKLEGPPNRRKTWSKYEFSEESEGCLKQVFDLMTSDAMFLLLSNLTGLRLHQLAPEDSDEEGTQEALPCNPKYRGCVRKWEQGNYTLICDDDVGQAEFALDARLCFNLDNWNEDMGGQTVYIARNEDDVLVMCEPVNNSLNLVYRDKETLRFVKYVNSLINTKNGTFYDLDFSYYE